MTTTIHITSIDPWTPVIDASFPSLPLILGGTPEADLPIEPRWTGGQWCEIIEGKKHPIMRLYETRGDRSPKTSLLQTLELEGPAEVKLGIRTLSVRAVQKRKARGKKAEVVSN